MENAETMMAATFGASFKCCFCGKTHSGLAANYRSVYMCYARLAERCGLEQPSSRSYRKWSKIPEATFSYSGLASSIFPELTDQTLDVMQYKHALAAPSLENGIAYLKGVIQKWKDGMILREKEMMAQDIEVPAFKTSFSYGLKVRFGEVEDKREVSFYYSGHLYSRLLQDDSLGSAAVAFQGNAQAIDMYWRRLIKPARFLFRLKSARDQNKGDAGCWLVAKEYGVKYVDQVCRTVEEAEGRLGLR